MIVPILCQVRRVKIVEVLSAKVISRRDVYGRELLIKANVQPGHRILVFASKGVDFVAMVLSRQKP